MFDQINREQGNVIPKRTARKLKPNDICNLQSMAFIYSIYKHLRESETLIGGIVLYPIVSYSLTSWKSIFASDVYNQEVKLENLDFDFTTYTDSRIITDIDIITGV